MRWTFTIVGIVVVVFALVWLFAIFPLFDKIPEKHDREINFEGTYYVMMDPAAQALEEIPVCVQRVQLATDVQDNVVIIDQTITCTHALADMVLPDFGLQEVLSVERSTREYVTDQADGIPRSGQFSFPSNVKKEESYLIWNPSAMRPLEAKFDSEEELGGLKVFVFKISEQGLDLGTDPVSGYPQVMDTEITMKVEPVTGTTVYTESYLARSIAQAPGPYYISSIAFTDDTRDELVDEAVGNRNLFLWATVYGFWIAIGVGAVLIVVGVVMFARATGK